MSVKVATRNKLENAMRNALRRNVKASRKESFGYFLQETGCTTSCQRMLAEYYYNREYSRWDHEEIGSGKIVVMPKLPTRRAASKPERKSVGGLSLKDRLFNSLVLMDCVLANGKRARHSTLGDATKTGGYWLEVGRHGLPSEAIDKVHTEQTLKDIRSRFFRNGKTTNGHQEARV